MGIDSLRGVGIRMTKFVGGGFAGTVQAFVPFEMLDDFRAGIDCLLGEGACHVLTIRSLGGVEMLANP